MQPFSIIGNGYKVMEAVFSIDEFPNSMGLIMFVSL
jgi:hypothetical protein